MNRNMTIPSRPAPPPPQRSAAPPSRYTPTTNWDFCAFDSGNGSEASINQTFTRNNQQQQNLHLNVKAKKPPPPRPPPPKLPTAPLKKPGQPQSINILSSLFGQKRASNGATANIGKSSTGSALSEPKSSASVATKLPPPPAPVIVAKGTTRSQHHLSQWTPTHTTNVGGGSGHGQSGAAAATGELISFDSPPSSPTFTQKSCSDCISVDSFSSDSNYSSPNNGNMSQAESGFEDDFVANNRVGSCIPWINPTCDPFDVGSMSNSSRAPSAPPSGIYAPLSLLSSSAAGAQIRTPLMNSKLQKSDFVDPLCNGRSVLSKVPTVSMPTIIKPLGTGSGSQKSTPSHSVSNLVNSRGNSAMQPFATKPKVLAANESLHHDMDEDLIVGDTSTFDSPPSPPMPCVPPPPPPSFAEYKEEPYGIAMYDYEGETMEDLNFKTSEKIYLLSRINEEWYMGRDRRGLEGMFPVNYVEVKVPLSSEQKQRRDESVSLAKAAGTQKVRALYQFTAETADDLTIMEHDLVTVLYQITPEWLYGEIDGRRGQFPANYIEYVPPNLKQIPVSLIENS